MVYCNTLDLELLQDPVVLLKPIVNKINIIKQFLVGYFILQLLLFLTLTKQTNVKTATILDKVFILSEMMMKNV